METPIDTILQTIVAHHGIRHGMVIQAALLVAYKRWTDDDTIQYGTLSRDALRSWYDANWPTDPETAPNPEM
jgi:hypothetical protein